MELVMHPLLLALEEPMRGLSHAEGHELVAVLQSLTVGGRLVIVSATEVPCALFEAAESLVLLDGDGQALYSGPKKGVEGFFRDRAGISNVEGEVLGELLATLGETEGAARVARMFAGSTVHQRILSQVEEHRKSIAAGSFGSIPHVDVPAPSYCQRWVLLTAYACRRATIGFRSLIIAWSILFFIFLVMVLLIAGPKSDQYSMHNRRGVVVFFLLSCSTQVNTVLIDAEVREFLSGVHLRNNNYFDTTQYFTATLLRLILPRVVFAIAGTMCAFPILEFYSSLATVLTMCLTSLADASITLLLVYWHPVERDIWIVQHVYHGYCIILSSFIISLPTVPKIFSALSLLRYSYGGVVSLELRDNTFSCDANATTYYCYTGSQYLQMVGFSQDTWGRSALILFSILIVFQILVAVSMKLVWLPSVK